MSQSSATAPGQCLSETPPPPELKAREQWVCWRYELRDGKKTKIPYNPHTDKKASSTDPDTWCFYIVAADAVAAGKYDGLGFVFSEDDPYAGVDFDHVRDPETGAVAEWATEWVEAFGGYAEVSPSGTGLHIIVCGLAPDKHNRKAGIEAYSTKRFFTFTSEAVSDVRDIPERQDVLDRFSEKFFPTKKRHTQPAAEAGAERKPVNIADQDLLEKARRASGGVGEIFTALYDRGDISEYPSHSEARHELLKHLAFWTAWDAPRMSDLYESSALCAIPGYAKKWARLGEKECQNAIAAQPRAYGQEVQRDRETGGEIAAVISACRTMAAAMAWEGRGGPTDRAVYGSLIGFAARYGTVAKRGIIFSADMRNLALDAGVSLTTTHKSMRRLRQDRKLIMLSKKSTSKKAAVYQLRHPNATQGLNTNPCDIYVQPLSNRLRQMRNAGPITEKQYDKNGRRIIQANRHLLRRLGKLTALVIEGVVLSGSDGVTEFELAQRLERRPQNVRRVLVKALAAGLVVEGEDLRFRAPDDFARRLEQELDASGCNAARERDAQRYSEERIAFCSRRERVADDAPTEEEMERDRLQRVQDALDILQDPGTGPTMIYDSYRKGETQTFDYVVNAVAYYYGSASAEMWHAPVKQAVELIEGIGGGGSE